MHDSQLIKSHQHEQPKTEQIYKWKKTKTYCIYIVYMDIHFLILKKYSKAYTQ